MRNHPPAIAVIMPVYNRAAVIVRAIQSVLQQTFTDFELIIVDDGSSDDTVRVAESIQDPRVTVLRADRNEGSNAARNRGIQAASAPLIAFLDSDDAYLPNKLALVARTFAERPEMDVLIDSFSKEYPAGDRRRPTPRRNPNIDSNQDFIKALFNRRLWKATSAISIRRETAIRAGLFDEALKRRQDFDFLVRASAVGRCASTAEVTWVKSWTLGAISDDIRTFIPATIELCRRHPAYFANPEYRSGLARDVARHFRRLLAARRFSDAALDCRSLRRQFGTAGLVRLLSEGSLEIAARKLKRRWPAPRHRASSAKDRSRGSGR
jgi:glycosyltransferase involved in cell wall biosynthesis